MKDVVVGIEMLSVRTGLKSAITTSSAFHMQINDISETHSIHSLHTLYI